MEHPKSISMGCCRFVLKSENPAFSDMAVALYPHFSNGEHGGKLIELTAESVLVNGELFTPATGSEAVQLLIALAREQHDSLLHFHGLVVRRDDGHLIGFLGNSECGKTTLAVALALGLNWQIVVEDLVFIDEQDSFVRVGAPFSLREGASGLIAEHTGVVPAPIYARQWLLRPDLYSSSAEGALCHSFVWLPALAHVAKALRFARCSAGQIVRAALPLSNALLVADGVERLEDFVARADCWILEGGNLRERMEVLCGLGR